MKEITVVRIKIIKQFYNDIIKNAIWFFPIGLLIIIVFELYLDFLAYLVNFLICFGVSFVLFFMSKEKRKEFTEDNI